MSRRLMASALMAITVSKLLVVGSAIAEVAPNEWRVVDAKGRFSFSLPPDMEEQTVQGKDSYVGEYRSSNIQFSFDYGWYSDPLEHDYFPTQPEYQEANVAIGGKSAKIVTFHRAATDSGFPYVAAVYFPDVLDGQTSVGMKTRLTMWADCKGQSEQEIAKKIFQSIRFHSIQKP